MKRIVIILLGMLMPLIAQAQFTMVYHGLRDPITQKDYLVYEFEGESQQQLHRKVLNYFLTKRTSMKHYVKDYHGEVITYRGDSFKAIKSDGSSTYTIDYELTVWVADGKIRIDSPLFEGRRYPLNEISWLMLNREQADYTTDITFLFNKDGTPNKRKAIDSVLKFFNQEVDQLVTALKDDNNW